MCGLSRARQQFISCSDHGPEVAKAVHCVDPDMTSFDAAAAAAATSFLHPTGALISRIAPYRAAHLGHGHMQ